MSVHRILAPFAATSVVVAVMRKRRVILFDDNVFVLDALKVFFEHRGYDVIANREAVLCPVYEGSDDCTNRLPCGDVMIMDLKMPRRTGLELLQAQIGRGCPLDIRNKAIMSGYVDAASYDAIRSLACKLIEKPFSFYELEQWLHECEQRMDLTQPIGMKRRELRQHCWSDVLFSGASGADLCRAALVNRSASGLCVKVDRPLAKDQVLELHSDRDIPLSSRRLVVRWTKTIDGREYLAGMSCIDRT